MYDATQSVSHFLLYSSENWSMKLLRTLTGLGRAIHVIKFARFDFYIKLLAEPKQSASLGSTVPLCSQLTAKGLGLSLA